MDSELDFFNTCATFFKSMSENHEHKLNILYAKVYEKCLQLHSVATFYKVGAAISDMSDDTTLRFKRMEHNRTIPARVHTPQKAKVALAAPNNTFKQCFQTLDGPGTQIIRSTNHQPRDGTKRLPTARKMISVNDPSVNT